MKIKKILFTVLALGIFIVPIVNVSAASGCQINANDQWFIDATSTGNLNCPLSNEGICNYSGYENDCGTCCLMNTVYNITDWAFLIIMVASVLMIVYGGFLFLQSQGESEKVGKAKQLILFAAVGIAVAVLSKAVPGIVMSFIT